MTPHDRDDERDAWLSAALRHAPDAQAAPPAALSETILRQARTAAREAKGATMQRRRSAWAAASDWLARPPVAAGFAALMVATVVGLIWWDRPIDEALVRPSAPDATPQARLTVPPETADAPSAASRDAAAPNATEKSEQSVAPARPEPPRLARTAPRSPAPATQPAPARPAAPTPFADSGAPAQAAPGGAERNTTADARDAPGTTAAGALERGAAKAAPSAPLAAASETARGDDAAPAGPATLFDAVAAQPQRWTWQRGEVRQPMSPAMLRWLRQLDAATAGRWRDGGGTAPPASSASASSSSADTLHLYRDGLSIATLRLGDDAVWFASGSRAALAPAAAASLRQGLDNATR